MLNGWWPFHAEKWKVEGKQGGTGLWGKNLVLK